MAGQDYSWNGGVPNILPNPKVTEERPSRKEFAAGVRSGGLGLLETVVLARVVSGAIRRRR